MSKQLLGAVCGIGFGIVAVLMMTPLAFEDKVSAMTAAFISRFSIGFFIGATKLPLPNWAGGLMIGLLVSLPDAIVTGAFIPILPMGALGGIIIAFIVGKWSK
jgi:hypothetical protein